MHYSSGRREPLRKPAKIIVLSALAALLFAGGALAKREKKVAMKKWIDGPIRYVITKDEAKAFKALESDSERSLFIERFWTRRDPDPETLTNAYRQMFWERVQQANSMFQDSSKEGWLTDRGKVHVLYGPPTEINEDLHLRTEGIAGGGYGVIRWIYERPGQRMDMDAIVVVPFVRDGSGEWRMSNDPVLASVFWNPTAMREAQASLADRFQARNAAGGRSELSVMLDLGKMQEVPPQEQILLESVETAENYETEPIELEVSRYLHPEDTETLVVVTADLGPSEKEDKPAMIARFSPLEADEVRLLGEDSFRVIKSEGTRIAQGRLLLEPGEYVLTMMVVDAVDISTGFHQTRIKIPGPNDRLRFSDVVWASQLEPLEYRALVSYDEPFHVGAFRVLPKLDSTFELGDTIRLFFEVYAAAPPFTVSYQLEGKEDDGSWVPLGQPSVGRQSAISQGWELPTAPTWPQGSYRIRIEVLDEQGRMITTQMPFTLQASEPS